MKARAFRLLTYTFALSIVVSLSTANAQLMAEGRCDEAANAIGPGILLREQESVVVDPIDRDYLYSTNWLSSYPIQVTKRAIDGRNNWVMNTVVKGPGVLAKGSRVYNGRLSLNKKADYFPVIIAQNYYGLKNGKNMPSPSFSVSSFKDGGYSQTQITVCLQQIERKPAQGSNRLRVKVIDSNQITHSAYPLKGKPEPVKMKLPKSAKAHTENIYMALIKASHLNPFWAPSVSIYLSVDRMK